jgi:hypothetical protein
MIVMPANSTGWFWHCLARETGKIGHLFSPDAQRGPWPWFPYALDNGAFAAWNAKQNTWDETRWSVDAWRRMLFWAQSKNQKPLWAIVPDVPGNAAATFERWHRFKDEVPFNKAIAVQDGMTVEQVKVINPDVVCIGGSTDWKWATVEQWAKNFKRVHMLRCNAPAKLNYLKELGVESCDGTGWNRGDKTQTKGLEDFVRNNSPEPTNQPLHPFVCKEERNKRQLTFA